MIDDELRARIERDIEQLRPFTWIASRNGVSYVDVALVHNRMPRPRPLQWPEAIPASLGAEAAEALRRDDLAQIASGDADDWLRALYERDGDDD